MIRFSALNVAGGVTIYPDAVNESGTEQYFAVTVTAGKQYVACWSFGEASTSTASSATRSTIVPSFLSTDDLISVRRSLIEEDNVSLPASPDVAGYSTSVQNDQSAQTADSERWFFVSLFAQSGRHSYFQYSAVASKQGIRSLHYPLYLVHIWIDFGVTLRSILGSFIGRFRVLVDSAFVAPVQVFSKKSTMWSWDMRTRSSLMEA